MASQAHRLMGCFFHPCGFAPEGGAPACWTVTPAPDERGSRNKRWLTRSAPHPRRVDTLTPGNDLPGNRQTAFDWHGANVSSQLFSNKRAEAERQEDFGLHPRTSA